MDFTDTMTFVVPILSAHQPYKVTIDFKRTDASETEDRTLSLSKRPESVLLTCNPGPVIALYGPDDVHT
ncbi:hypothetical protein CHS0354_003723, partial [Potamilus streckersoni]